MKYHYRLVICLESIDQAEKISDILGMKPLQLSRSRWEIEIEESEDDPYVDFVEYFLDILEKHIPQLEDIGILRSDISIWMFYKYDGQCNLEFTPKQLKRLGNEGLSLCVSCWES